MTQAEVAGVGRDSFGDVYRTHRRAVVAFVRARVRDHQLAEDIVSETFLRALKSADRFVAVGGGVGAWLQTIARNVIYDEYKSAYRQRVVLCESLEHTVDPDPNPEEVALQVQRNAPVARMLAEQRLAILNLTEDQAEVMRYRYVDGLTVKETAQITGKAEGAVKAACWRGTRNLHRRMREVCGELSSS